MSKYRNALPQLGPRLFLTDGGLETTLIFLQGIDLPYFASCELLRNQAGRDVLTDYFVPYIETARRAKLGFVLEAPTWRANPDWARKLGYDARALADANRTSIGLLLEMRKELETSTTPIVISGNIGPRGDGYQPSAKMSAMEAADYHDGQVSVFIEHAQARRVLARRRGLLLRRRDPHPCSRTA